jgi:hypothetical protein
MKKKSSTKTISAKSFDKKFEKGESVLDYLDLDKSLRRVNVDFPEWTIHALDQESARLGVSRQALIKTWITEKIDSIAKNKSLTERPI